MTKLVTYKMIIHYRGLFGGKEEFDIISHAILENGSFELITSDEIFILIPLRSIKKVVFDSIFTKIVKSRSDGLRNPPPEKI
jgi:hypothetical protein